MALITDGAKKSSMFLCSMISLGDIYQKTIPFDEGATPTADFLPVNIWSGTISGLRVWRTNYQTSPGMGGGGVNENEIAGRKRR